MGGGSLGRVTLRNWWIWSVRWTDVRGARKHVANGKGEGSRSQYTHERENTLVRRGASVRRVWPMLRRVR